ncbi:MAG: hypothetical protein NZ942_02730 [Candidatus Aenigmarchaeota archaeon]|nr:hypothetical protein [Candidatus Aenigmarchaeota archaeon]
MEAEAEKVICNLFSYQAPIVFVTGRFGTGKTDFSLLIAEILLKNGVIHKFGSNIKVIDPKGYNYTYITNLVSLKEWLYPKHEHKLFILDEAGINIDRRNPLGKLNKQIRYLGFLLRKFRGKLIFISQRSKDIESTFADTDIWLATFKKLSKTEAILVSNVFTDPYHFYNIPKTSLDFDTYDIAMFTSEPNYSDLEAKTLERKILYDWLEHGNYGKIAKAYGLHIQQVKRIILNEVKDITQARFMEEEPIFMESDKVTNS